MFVLKVGVRVYAPVVPLTIVLLSVMVAPEAVLYTKPLSVTVDPPSDVTLPFNIALVVAIDVAALEVTAGAVDADVVVPFIAIEPTLTVVDVLVLPAFLQIIILIVRQAARILMRRRS